MKITFFANAMVLLEGKSTSVLCDPWITFDMVSSSGFYNFPEATLSRADIAAIKPGYIYITHTHPDHFDPTTLHLFDRNTPILVADYAGNNFTARAVRRAGFSDLRIVPRDGSLDLSGPDKVWMEPAANAPDVDSIAIFRIDGKNAVNANDNIFDQEQCERIRDRAGGVNIALLPSSAHGPFPMFFENFTADEKKRLAQKRGERQTADFVRYIKTFKPRWVVPIAGGLVAAGPKVRQYIYSGIRPRTEVIQDALKKVTFEPILLSEGNSYNFSTEERHGTYVEKTYATEKNYIDRLADHQGVFSAGGLFHISPSERIDLTRMLTLARQTQRKWQTDMKSSSKMTYFFDVGDEKLYRLSLADESVQRVAESDITDDVYEIFRLPYELIVGLLTRHYVWSNVKTQHVTYYRKAPGMDAELMLLLNYLQV